MGFKLTGDKQLDRALSKLEPKIARTALRKTLIKAAKNMRKEVLERTPRESGELAGGIKVRAGKRSRSSMSRVVQVPNDSFKASAQEYGTVKQQPTPFLRPTLDKEGPAIKDTALKDLRDAIEAEAEKLRKQA